ncbi:MAG TPA: heme peroxidase family protein [Vicinamibacterales bacterium]|nr:heme peroxidase family protein [Vicinamibacterales bacterium]
MRYVVCLAVTAAVVTAGSHAIEAQHHHAPSATEFTRIFQHLPAFAPPSARIRTALVELGRKGGPMDAGDNLAAGPIELIVNPALNINNPNSASHTAGATFMGQFFDHDMTFDTTSRLGQPTHPHTAPNRRRPFFDLDSVYGDGPSGSPLLYDPVDRAKFRVEHGGLFEDLPRDANGTAIIADPRNDENLVISGLQVAFLLFHNAMVDRVRNDEPELSAEDVFDEARRMTTLHYQWLLVHEFLPQFAGGAIVNDVLANGGRLYPTRDTEGTIPVEFQMAYRFGHSLVRPSYRANFTGNGGAAFFAMLFDGGQPPGAEPTDLRGGARGSRRFIGWQTFFEFPGFETDARPNKRIDTKLSTPLFELPFGAIASGLPPIALAERNLLRHLTWSLPSGQAIAAAMGGPVLPDSAFAELKAIEPAFVSSTPLWYYVLREAELLANGETLGPIGGRLVAEVFLGLLRADGKSILNQAPPFVPTLGAVPGAFTMIDFLRVAGVDQKR